MTNDKLAARLLVLETLAMAALGSVIRFGKSPLPAHDVIRILDSVRQTVYLRMAEPSEDLSHDGRAELDRYLDYLLSEFSESLIPKPPGSEPRTKLGKD